MEAEGYKDHRTRDLLFEYIRDNPGSTFKRLKAAFNLTDGTLRYHLDYLQKKRKVVQERTGKEKCYFSYIRKRFPYSDPSLKLTPDQERILEIISRDPGIAFSDLSLRSGQKKETFEYNLKKLRKMKLVWKIEGIEGYGYEIVTKEKLSDEIFIHTVNKFLEGEIEKGEMMSIMAKVKKYRDSEK